MVEQILTPAYDVAGVAWKRAQLRSEQFKCLVVKPEQIERAIEDDVRWLEAHPTKKSVAASRQKRGMTANHGETEAAYGALLAAFGKLSADGKQAIASYLQRRT